MAIQAPAFGPLLGASFDRAVTLTVRSGILWGIAALATVVLGSISFLNAFWILSCVLVYWFFASLANTVRLVNPSYRMTASTVFSLIGLGFVMGIAIDIGLILLIVPGIYIANRWSLAPLILAKDQCGITESMARSWAITEAFFWPTLGFNILSGLALWAVGIAGYLVFAAVLGAVIFARTGSGTAALTQNTGDFGGLFGAMIALAYCVYAFAIAYTYQAKDVALLNWYVGLQGALGTTTA